METGRRASGSVLRALMTPAAPEISIIVPVRFARQTINSTLKALLEQCEGIAAEIIAVVSSTDPTREALRELACDPKLRIIEMPGRRSVPELRGEGVRLSRGKLIAITEDHCSFPPGWAAGMIDAHRTREIAAVGGPVENGRAGGCLDWAIYFSRYLGSMPPLDSGPAASLPGNNACYKREALERCAPLLAGGFWENDVNRELLALGYILWLDPRLTVIHRKPYRFAPYLALRYRHARCFGGMIARTLTGFGRMRRILFSPLIPALLMLRSMRLIQAKKRRRREFLVASPALLLCYLVWFWGEVAGYIAGAGAACSETD